jgi:tetratricopeptide (TPR) repeat protein
MRLFRRRSKVDQNNSDRVAVDPNEIPQPQSSMEYLRRGYAFYARSLFPEAEDDFRKAIELDPEAVDAVYALGMALKAHGRHEESIQVFKQVLSLLNAGAVADRVRADMLRRLAVGHINFITSGDWNLEKEIWQKVE